MQNFEQFITDIQKRNRRVEADKAWETSFTRKILIALFTYTAIGLYLDAVKIEQPWKNAVVPTIGFMLATATLPFFKKLWMKYYYKQENLAKNLKHKN